MSGITLHPKKGINPKIVVCRQCGKDTGLALVGLNDKVITCNNCGTNNIADKFGDKCGKCQKRLSKSVDKWRVLEDNEKIPGELCDECLEEAKQHEEIVRLGGIYWQCNDCGQRGVIKRSDYSLKIKKALGVKENDLCGVMFDKIDCPAHCCKPDE